MNPNWQWHRAYNGNVWFRPTPGESVATLYHARELGLPLTMGCVFERMAGGYQVIIYTTSNEVDWWTDTLQEPVFDSMEDAKRYCETLCRMEAA